jgi:RNA polymerase sigma factor (sigma-70 family)
VERRLPEYEPRGRLKAWLASIARNLAWQYRRRRARAPALVGSSREAEQELRATMRDHDHDDAETGAMMREVFFRVLDELEDNRRIVFVMHEVQGIPIAEVALALDIPEGTAWTRLRLARADFEAVCKRLAARERGNAVLFGMLAPAALLEVGRTMPPLPAGVHDRPPRRPVGRVRSCSRSATPACRLVLPSHPPSPTKAPAISCGRRPRAPRVRASRRPARASCQQR